MEKFTKSIKNIILLCLILAGNCVYSKNATFFDNSSLKKEWSKKGFGSTTAKPDAKYAYVSVNQSQIKVEKSFFGNCTQTVTVNGSINTTTQVPTTAFTYTTAGSILTNTNSLSTTLTTSTGTTTAFTYTLVDAVGTFTNTNTASSTTTTSQVPTTAFTYAIAGGTFTNTNSASTILTEVATTVNGVIITTQNLNVAIPVINSVNWPQPGLVEISYTANVPPGALVAFYRNGILINPFYNSGNQFKDRDLISNTDYVYQIEINLNGCGTFSLPKTARFEFAAPSNLTATSVNCSQINLAWKDNSHALFSEESFKIYRSENGGAFNLVATPIANATSFSDNALKANTNYAYQIIGQFGSGISNPSNTATAATKPLVFNLVSNSATSAKLKWDLCSPNIQGWKIYASTNNGVDYKEFAQVGPLVDNYEMKNLIPDKTYKVYLANIFSSGLGTPSSVITFTTPKFPPPSDLKITPVGVNAFKVTWKDNSNGPDFEDAFWLYKSIDNGKTYTPITTLLPTIAEYLDSGLKANQKVCYYAVARHFNGFSEPSNTACEVTCPNPITEITKITPISTTQIDMEWNLPENVGETKIVVESSLDGIAFTKIDEISGTSTSYSDKNVLPNQMKYYRLLVTHSGTCGKVYSLVSSSTTCPLAPTGVKATALNSSEIEVNWDLVEGIKTYTVERSTDNIDFVKAGEVEGKLSSFMDTKLASSKKYYYRVYANNMGTCTSATSQVKQESTAFTCPAPPSNLVAVANSAKEIKITFTDNSPDETGFDVEWSKDEKTWAKVGSTLTANTTSLTISTGIDAETKYFFRVKTVGELCNSVASNIANATTNPPAPTTLAAKAVKINQIDLSWVNTSKTATGIEIQRASGTDNTFTAVGTDIVATLTAFQNTSLTPATNYKYRIRAKGPSGVSEWSNVADATTFVIAAIEDPALAKKVALFPVPTQNMLYIKPSISIIGKINTKIYNNKGVQLITKDFLGFVEGKTEEVNVSSLGTGFYILEISTLKGNFTKKFMKQ